ncbi:MAG: DinB family protein [Salinibacter sp.]|uniref:DinB family protein n=1 Tax=Salinibacter sp. TaxID=2065818 RepID=UPI0035D51F1B
MPPPARDLGDFASLFRHARWANSRVLSAMQDADAEPGRAVELLSHLLRVQDMWRGRVEGTGHADLSLWVDEDLAACAERAGASARRWEALLERCSPEDLDRAVAYVNSEGTPFETPLRDILTHVVNHSTHHRAQIALVLREAGVAPPSTGYIFYVREA